MCTISHPMQEIPPIHQGRNLFCRRQILHGCILHEISCLEQGGLALSTDARRGYFIF